ncbi:MAG: sugar phosphate isomerase/epimerase [Verrucomicrobiales bacterium]
MLADRRTFLKTAALVPTAGLLHAAKAGGCKLAIGTYGLQSLPLAEAIRVVAETGYDALEITAFEGTTGAPAALEDRGKRAEIRQTIEDGGLSLGGLMAGLQPQQDDDAHREQLEELKQLIELAHDLAPENPPLIQTVLGGKNWEESRDLFRDRLADWLQLAADRKGVLSIKPHRGHAMSLPAHANWLVEQLGAPDRLGTVYDYSHYAFREPPLSIAETVAAALPHTNYVAVKDAVQRDGKIVFALAGESRNWDHADIVRAFHEGGYRGDFCCEVSSQIWRNNPDYDPVASTQLCYRNMAAAFERANVPRG